MTGKTDKLRNIKEWNLQVKLYAAKPTWFFNLAAQVINITNRDGKMYVL